MNRQVEVCRNCCCVITNTLITYRELNSHNSTCRSLYANYALTSSPTPPPPPPVSQFYFLSPTPSRLPRYTENLEQARWTQCDRSERLFTLPPAMLLRIEERFFFWQKCSPQGSTKGYCYRYLKIFLQMYIQVFVWQKIHSILNACNF